MCNGTQILPETDEELFERQRLLRYTVDRQKFISDKKALIATSTEDTIVMEVVPTENIGINDAILL